MRHTVTQAATQVHAIESSKHSGHPRIRWPSLGGNTLGILPHIVARGLHAVHDSTGRGQMDTPPWEVSALCTLALG